jgi:hypothetical protein
MDPVKTPVVDPPKTGLPYVKAQPQPEQTASHPTSKPIAVEPKPKM